FFRMRLILLLFIFIDTTHSLVDFTYSALYDIYDFKGVKEVHIPKCDSGCFIFAATAGEYPQYPEGLDPYAINLYVSDNNAGGKYSIARLAQQRDTTQKKIPLQINGPGKIYVINENNESDLQATFPIVLYVVDQAKAKGISYEVYDVYYTDRTTITPQSDIVTFLSTYAIQIQADANTQLWNSVTARLVGFDNALDINQDGCPYAYKTPDSPFFPGFTIQAAPPILSLVVGKINALQFKLTLKFEVESFLDVGVDGFFNSPGWNGCTKEKNGGIQSFRSPNDLGTNSFILDDNVNRFNVEMEVLPNLDANHNIMIIDNGNPTKAPIVVSGYVQRHYSFLDTNNVLTNYANLKGDQGFLTRYTSTLISKPTTTDPNGVTQTKTSPTTSPTQSLTTSSGYQSTGCILSMTTDPNGVTQTKTSPTTSPTQSPTTSSGYQSTGCILSMMMFLLII
ncbi:hypothetical protein PENTCL1PPCAC_2959, partial [Pristionchus entomophagus]